MIRICSTLFENGYDVLLIGRKKPASLPLNFAFKTDRLNCFFQKGKLFYIEYNLRLFFYLLFSKSDILCAIDLDSILPNYYISKWKNIPLVYDAHEYFTEVIEVTNRPQIKRLWEKIEAKVVPDLKYAYTVNSSLASLYKKKYHTNFEVIRNISVLKPLTPQPSDSPPYIIYAGALNAGRGLEETIDAMQHCDINLMICGDGDLTELLKLQVQRLKLAHKVFFKGYVQPDELQQLIEGAYAGILVLKNEGLSYYYSLANKFFDYLHAGIPQITTDFPEYSALNEVYQVALYAELDTGSIAKAINQLLNNKALYNQLQANALSARQELNWQKESKKLIAFYDQIK